MLLQILEPSSSDSFNSSPKDTTRGRTSAIYCRDNFNFTPLGRLTANRGTSLDSLGSLLKYVLVFHVPSAVLTCTKMSLACRLST